MTSDEYLIKSCDSISNSLERFAPDDFFYINEDGNESNYLDEDNYNTDVVWRMGYGVIGVRIMVACGGPNIWIDTIEGAVCGYWGADTYKAYLTTATNDAIVDHFVNTSLDYLVEDIRNA